MATSSAAPSLRNSYGSHSTIIRFDSLNLNAFQTLWKLVARDFLERRNAFNDHELRLPSKVYNPTAVGVPGFQFPFCF